MFAIEEVSIPKNSRVGVARLEYPVADLTAGSNQSFLIPATPEEVKKVSASVRAFAYRNDLKVTLRYDSENAGVRVWRPAVATE